MRSPSWCMAGPKTGRRSAGRAGSTRSAPDRRVLLLPDAAFDPAEVHYAAVWKPQPGELAAFPNLRVIFNLGAGVDALMADQLLARRAAGARRRRRSHRADDRICRAACADASPAGALFAGVAARQSAGRRNCNGRRARSRSASWGWARSAPTRPTRCSGIGFRVAGWSRSPKHDRRHRMLSRRGAVRRVPAADRHPGLPAAADAGHAAHPQPRRCSRNSTATARSARRC